jgi:hypothetical protein
MTIPPHHKQLTPQQQELIDLIKQAETKIGPLWNLIHKQPDTNKRWTETSRTHLEEGFSALIRAVANPTTHF